MDRIDTYITSVRARMKPLTESPQFLLVPSYFLKQVMETSRYPLASLLVAHSRRIL